MDRDMIQSETFDRELADSTDATDTPCVGDGDPIGECADASVSTETSTDAAAESDNTAESPAEQEPVHRVSAWDRPKKIENKRKGGRFRCELLRCSLGEVRDLSPTGMRVIRSARKPLKVGTVKKVRVESLVGAIRVRCRVVWSHMADERTNQMGVEFVNITPEQAEAIKEAAYCSSVRRTIGGKAA